jgi:patatin-like phospholipase/acyl hydrolase
MVETPPSVPKTLLSLDGGGIKGISTLVILDAIMTKIKSFEKDEKGKERLPFNYFDLAGGTSTGGLIALMLFRLCMPVSKAIKAYKDLAPRVFSPTIDFKGLGTGTFGYWMGNGVLKTEMLIGMDKFSNEPLIDSIDQVVRESKNNDEPAIDGKAKLVKDRPDGRGKM